MPDGEWDGGAGKGRETAVYSYDELRVALDEHCKDKIFWGRALSASRRIWWRGRNVPEELVHAAVVKVLGYVQRGGVVSKDRSLLAALVWNMGLVAIDYFRSADALGPKHAKEMAETALAAALEKPGPWNSNPERQAEALDLMRKMYALAAEQEHAQKESGKERVLPLGEYLRLRLQEGLEGEDVRKALNLTKRDSEALISQVKRLRERLKLKGDR